MADDTGLQQALLRTTLDAIAASRPASAPAHPCVICLDEVSERAQAQPCQHDAFDFVCLASWLEERARCPLCNAAVSAVRYAFAGEDYKTYTVPAPQPAPPAPAPPSSQALPSRRRRRASPPPPALRREDDPLEVRRAVYRRELYSLHVGANRVSRFAAAPPRPADFAADPALLARAKAFMRRELQVFEFLRPREPEGAAERGGSASAAGHGSSGRASGPPPRRQAAGPSASAEFLLAYLAAVLQSVDLQDSRGQAAELLAEFLGARHAALFVHELRAWLRSPYTSLEAWDRHVQYAEDPRREGEEGERAGKRRRVRGRDERDGRRVYDRYVPSY